jgi:hypothetical protein
MTLSSSLYCLMVLGLIKEPMINLFPNPSLLVVICFDFVECKVIEDGGPVFPCVLDLQSWASH